MNMGATSDGRGKRVWVILALLWALLLCFGPDPRPLSTPVWSIDAVRSLLGLEEAAARVIAAIGLRMVALGILGMLLMFGLGTARFERRSILVLLLAPVIGILTLWVNHRYFPFPAQMQLAAVSVCAGSLFALLLRRNWVAGGALVAVLGLLFVSLTNYSVEDDLAMATQAHVKYLLDSAPSVPDGDEGFLALTRTAFTLASKRSAAGDPVLENQAAVLGLALVLGDEKLANAAKRYIDPQGVALMNALRARITLHSRPDWSRHFCVSAGLVILSDGSRSQSVGVLKELKDANAGGSGFSFGDLTADVAGERFAQAATRDVAAAVSMQHRMTDPLRSNPLWSNDIMPDPSDLPEGIYVDEFEARYGGVSGALTDSLVQVIIQRIEETPLLR
jgi:hypothetical protein